MHGETITGVTSFFIDKEIDTGKIILYEKVEITPDMTAGELHDILMVKGAELAVKTVKTIENREVSLTDQSQLTESQNTILNTAPKIFKEDCYINVSGSLKDIYNHIRGLSPYPAAIARLSSDSGNELPIKIYKAHAERFANTGIIGSLASDGKTFLAIEHPEGRIYIDELQVPGKKRLGIADYLRGSQLSTSEWKLRPL
jgi:methionyl-tRNA formyltransferase